jgi:hypothetical protein
MIRPISLETDYDFERLIETLDGGDQFSLSVLDGRLLL